MDYDAMIGLARSGTGFADAAKQLLEELFIGGRRRRFSPFHLRTMSATLAFFFTEGFAENMISLA
jgi:hypothetical protein